MATVNLTWTAPNTGEIPDTYQLYRKTGGDYDAAENATGFGDLATNVAGQPVAGNITVFSVAHSGALNTGQSFADDTCADATTYHYCVKSVKGTLESTEYASSGDTDGGVVFTITTA